MNLTNISNTALFAVGVAGVTASLELAKSSNWIGAIITGVVGLAAILLYENLPASTPTITPSV